MNDRVINGPDSIETADTRRDRIAALRTAIIGERARAIRAEFYETHGRLPDGGAQIAICKTCIREEDHIYRPDIRHSYKSDAQWHAAAESQLIKEGVIT